MMNLWSDERRHSRARFKPKKTPLFPGRTSQLKVNCHLFTTVWVLVGPVGWNGDNVTVYGKMSGGQRRAAVTVS